MTGQRQKCPTSDLTGDRHTVTDPAGVETVLCSPSCTIMWMSYAIPADARFPNPTHAEIPHGSGTAA
jgi:hypothetical protein